MHTHTHTPSHIQPQTHTSLCGEQRTAVEDENGERGTEREQGNDTVIRHIQTVTDVQLLYTTKPPQLECGVLHAHVAIYSLRILHSVCSPPIGVPIQSYTCNVVLFSWYLPVHVYTCTCTCIYMYTGFPFYSVLFAVLFSKHHFHCRVS